MATLNHAGCLARIVSCRYGLATLDARDGGPTEQGRGQVEATQWLYAAAAETLGRLWHREDQPPGAQPPQRGDRSRTRYDHCCEQTRGSVRWSKRWVFAGSSSPLLGEICWVRRSGWSANGLARWDDRSPLRSSPRMRNGLCLTTSLWVCRAKVALTAFGEPGQ